MKAERGCCGEKEQDVHGNERRLSSPMIRARYGAAREQALNSSSPYPLTELSREHLLHPSAAFLFDWLCRHANHSLSIRNILVAGDNSVCSNDGVVPNGYGCDQDGTST